MNKLLITLLSDLKAIFQLVIPTVQVRISKTEIRCKNYKKTWFSKNIVRNNLTRDKLMW